MPTVSLAQVVQALDRDSQQLRIKKLLICTCYGHWENNPDRIQSIPMGDLVETVLMRSPTLESLQYELNRVVKTLSKPVEYAHVANRITSAAIFLYQQPTSSPPPNDQGESTLILDLETSNDDNESTSWLQTSNPAPSYNPYTEALNVLKQHPYHQRLKKLAVCACQNTWENDPDRLKSISWDKLLPQMLDLLPKRQNLEYVLSQIVNSLSKPEIYRPIAQTLIQTLLPLYEDEEEPELPFIDTQSPTAPLVTTFRAPLHPPAPPPPKPAPPARIQPTPMMPVGDGESTAFFAPPQQGFPLEGQEPNTSATAPDWQVQTIVPHDDALASPIYDPFDLRIEVMKYTNPLLVKILIYSLLYQRFDFYKSDWHQLREFDLDSLIQSLCQQFQHYQELETCLQSMAHELPEPDLMVQAAGTILRVLKPTYLQRL